MKLLRIDAGSRLKNSHTRELADSFVEHWLATHKHGEVVVRDLVQSPVPHISDTTITGFYTEKDQHVPQLRQATALSDELITELMGADTLLLTSPMYNFSVPSALKAWIDQVVRINETFSFTAESGFSGLVNGKRAVVITASGAVFSNDGMQAMNFHSPYLMTLLRFIGITNIELINLEGTTTDEAAFKLSKQHALQQIEQIGGGA